MHHVKTICLSSQLMHAGCRPGSRDPFVSAQGPKTIDAQSGYIKRTNARGRADQLAWLKQGPPAIKSVRPYGLTAGVELLEERVMQEYVTRIRRLHGQE